MQAAKGNCFPYIKFSGQYKRQVGDFNHLIK